MILLRVNTSNKFSDNRSGKKEGDICYSLLFADGVLPCPRHPVVCCVCGWDRSLIWASYLTHHSKRVDGRTLQLECGGNMPLQWRI